MGIRDPEFPTKAGTIDSTAITDGGALNSHLLRVPSMLHNRLVAKGEPLCNLVWSSEDSGSAEEYLGHLTGIGWPFWHFVTPAFTVAKKPGLTLSDLDVVARIIDNGVTARSVLIQAVTMRSGFSPSGTGSNILTMTGDNDDDFDIYQLTDVPIDRGRIERLAFACRGVCSGDAGATGTYGSPNTGTVGDVGENWFESNAATTWNLTTVSATNNWADGGHYVEFLDGSSNLITSVRGIVMVATGSQTNNTERCYIHPPLTTRDMPRLPGSTFNIKKLPDYSICNIAMYPEDRTE